MPSVRARSFAVPSEIIPSGSPVAISPGAAALSVPSPPPITTRSTSPAASRIRAGRPGASLHSPRSTNTPGRPSASTTASAASAARRLCVLMISKAGRVMASRAPHAPAVEDSGLARGRRSGHSSRRRVRFVALCHPSIQQRVGDREYGWAKEYAQEPHRDHAANHAYEYERQWQGRASANQNRA